MVGLVSGIVSALIGTFAEDEDIYLLYIPRRFLECRRMDRATRTICQEGTWCPLLITIQSGQRSWCPPRIWIGVVVLGGAFGSSEW